MEFSVDSIGTFSLPDLAWGIESWETEIDRFLFEHPEIRTRIEL